MTVYGQYPFAGRWLVQNSPANRVPSHGTELFSTAYAMDFVPVDAAGRTAPISVRSIFRREEPVVGKCGNSGNSTQPHLHVQAMTTADINRARAIPLKFSDAGLPRNGEIIETD